MRPHGSAISPPTCNNSMLRSIAATATSPTASPRCCSAQSARVDGQEIARTRPPGWNRAYSRWRSDRCSALFRATLRSSTRSTSGPRRRCAAHVRHQPHNHGRPRRCPPYPRTRCCDSSTGNREQRRHGSRPRQLRRPLRRSRRRLLRHRDRRGCRRHLNSPPTTCNASRVRPAWRCRASSGWRTVNPTPPGRAASRIASSRKQARYEREVRERRAAELAAGQHQRGHRYARRSARTTRRPRSRRRCSRPAVPRCRSAARYAPQRWRRLASRARKSHADRQVARAVHRRDGTRPARERTRIDSWRDARALAAERHRLRNSFEAAAIRGRGKRVSPWWSFSPRASVPAAITSLTFSRRRAARAICSSRIASCRRPVRLSGLLESRRSRGES